MSEELFDRLDKDSRFIWFQHEDGSIDAWFNKDGFFDTCSECGVPTNQPKILNGVYRDTKEFDETIERFINIK